MSKHLTLLKSLHPLSLAINENVDKQAALVMDKANSGTHASIRVAPKRNLTIRRIG